MDCQICNFDKCDRVGYLGPTDDDHEFPDKFPCCEDWFEDYDDLCDNCKRQIGCINCITDKVNSSELLKTGDDNFLCPDHYSGKEE